MALLVPCKGYFTVSVVCHLPTLLSLLDKPVPVSSLCAVLQDLSKTPSNTGSTCQITSHVNRHRFIYQHEPKNWSKTSTEISNTQSQIKLKLAEGF